MENKKNYSVAVFFSVFQLFDHLHLIYLYPISQP